MVYLPSEIILQILREVGYGIAPFLRVNSQWFGCGISLVWRYTRSWLLARVAKHRRQIYASATRSLDIDIYRGPDNRLEEFSDLSFPKLEILLIDYGTKHEGTLVDISYLKCYLHQGITDIHLTGAFHPQLLSLLPVVCPQLQGVFISSSGPLLKSEILLEYLEKSPSLSTIQINCEEIDTNHLLHHLATRKHLETLRLEGIIDTDAMTSLTTSSLFQALQKLVISVTAAALPTLCDVVQSVRHLDLTLKEPPGSDSSSSFDSSALRHVSKLVKLQNLNLVVWGDMRILNEDLLSLRSLTQLRDFSISGLSAMSLIAPRLEDTDFAELFDNFGQLESLTFEIYHPRITTDSLMSLGKCCPSLQHCEMMGFYDMAAFRYEKLPLFPKLEALSIGAFTNMERMFSYRRPYDHVRQLEKHFPNLKELDCTFRTFPIVEDDFPEKVLQAWWGRQAKAKKAKP
ncbi:hypothetical protein BDV26DRAFT_255748 [Aspergillus bertholletiae]|uniref:F-box domain-containing protein n=1 Tax=Aspergillus bertholletiae TaxID=1226010 RepID=A0A5N7BHP4_9EURO|nr:hypothetical protein BDV26DRAFT_255748 [Aspergillus bertholletiae]